jgi:hypothetical protein
MAVVDKRSLFRSHLCIYVVFKERGGRCLRFLNYLKKIDYHRLKIDWIDYITSVKCWQVRNLRWKILSWFCLICPYGPINHKVTHSYSDSPKSLCLLSLEEKLHHSYREGSLIYKSTFPHSYDDQFKKWHSFICKDIKKPWNWPELKLLNWKLQTKKFINILITTNHNDW